MVYKCFDKKISGSGIKNENISNQLLENSSKEKYKVQSPFIDNICGDDLADMKLISKFNKGIRFSLFIMCY